MVKTGIDCIAYYVPQLFLDIRALAEARGIEPDKLTKGLGLTAMGLCDADEDTATMAAMAALSLIENNGIDPRTVGRLYLGTESALDSAKPTATYVAGILEKALEGRYGERCLKNCDVLDMTFACVGGVDALHNSLEWVRAEPSRRAIVLAADFAKYALRSAGEYTQGAGAVAMLVAHEPRLCTVSGDFGVATCSVGDFYKPHRAFDKRALLAAALLAAGVNVDQTVLDGALDKLAGNDFWGHEDVQVFLHRDEPVFDGPLSNDCYCDRLTEALADFSRKQPLDVLADWDHLAFHQPYAYQGRRMIVRNWVDWMEARGRLDEVEQQVGMKRAEAENPVDFYKAAAKTAFYKAFVGERIERGEKASTLIGNMYTASIFMSLVSLLRSLYDQGTEAAGQTIGCLSYGSGSKSKVFALKIADKWREVIAGCDIFGDLSRRTEVDFATYEALHSGRQTMPVVPGKRISFAGTGSTPTTEGLRSYRVE